MNVATSPSFFFLFFREHRFISKNFCDNLPKSRGIIDTCIIVTVTCVHTLLQHRSPHHRVLFSGSIGIGKSVVLIPLLKQPIITHSFRIGRASRCTSLQRHRHNGETLQAAARPGTDGISKCSSAVFEFAVPSWINYRADSYTTAKARAWRMRNIKGGIRMRGGEGKGLRVCAGTRVSLLHTRDRHPPPPHSSPLIPLCSVSPFLHECTAIVVHRSFLFFSALLSRSPAFSYACFFSCFFLFSYDNHPIQLCPFETMAQVRRSHA